MEKIVAIIFSTSNLQSTMTAYIIAILKNKMTSDDATSISKMPKHKYKNRDTEAICKTNKTALKGEESLLGF